MTVEKFILTLVLAMLIVQPVAAQSTADLLQKGIYTQETVGDLDGAIKIYRQIVSSASQSRAYAAQAEYRLGLCLLKKGEKADAAKAFEKLARDYPEEKELVAKIREFLPGELKLLPIPWPDDELTEYRSKLDNGVEVGRTIYSVEANPGNSQNVVFLTRGYIESMPIRLSRVEAEREAMRPISSSFKILYMMEANLEYSTNQARVKSGNKNPRTIALEQQTFDNEEALFLFRRLPLSAGFKTTISFLSPSGIVVNTIVVVSSLEEVKVPAGKFHCYKLELPDLNQTIWIADDPVRTVVKFSSEGGSAELVSIRKIDRTSPVDYQDAKVGLSLSASPGWAIRPEETVAKDETSISLLDPESKLSMDIWAKQTITAPAEIAHELRTSLDKRSEHRADSLKGWRVRPETIQTRQIGGNQSLSCVAEFMRGNDKMIEYMTWVRTEHTNLLFAADGPASDLDEFHKRLDPIIETVKPK